MTVLSVASRVALMATLVVASLSSAMAATEGQTCTGATGGNVLANLVYTQPRVEACVRERCIATLGTVPTIYTNGYCNGVATAEADVPCDTLFRAYNEYYACVMRALEGSTETALAPVVSQVNMFMTTPGYPYHLSPLGCYACTHFRETVFPALSSTCTSWTCDAVSSQSAAATWYGQPGKGYNYQLCGTGCIAAMLLTIPFALVSASIFIACGCCWPSPSLKSTYAAMQREEEAEKMRLRSDDEDDEDDNHREPVEAENDSVAHEPVATEKNLNNPEEEKRPAENADL